MFKCAIMDLLYAGIYPSPAQIQKHTGRKVTNNLSGQQCRWRREVMEHWTLKNPDHPLSKKWFNNRVGPPGMIWISDTTYSCAACQEPIKQAALFDASSQDYTHKMWLSILSEDDDPVWSKGQLCSGYCYEEPHTPNRKAELDKINSQLDSILAR